MDLGLKGKVAMVAGASRGLGFAVAEALAREGATVSMSSTTQASIDEAAKRLASGGATVLATAVDVRNGDHIAAWTKKTIERFGGVDLLFTNGGGPPPARPCRLTMPRGRTRWTCCCSARCAWSGRPCRR